MIKFLEWLWSIILAIIIASVGLGIFGFVWRITFYASSFIALSIILFILIMLIKWKIGKIL